MLATYACNPETTRGRLYFEEKTRYRNEFQRDKDRLIHSNSFRRMQYKTQVFINHEGDHHRNRLTHSIEVASIARSIADSLHLSPDLAECIALAHDLGHPPFGHSGEFALNAAMKDYEGFCHNAHTLKLLTLLEKRYASYRGLNLTWEVIEGVAKHNGPLIAPYPVAVIQADELYKLELNSYSSGEAQAAAVADDIAYLCHDLEDGVRSGLLAISTIETMPILLEYLNQVRRAFGKDLTDTVLIYETVRGLMHDMIDDILNQTQSNITEYKINSEADIRNMGRTLVCFSPKWEEQMPAIKKFLFKNLYHHDHIIKINEECNKVIAELFKIYYSEPVLLPQEWQTAIKECPTNEIMSNYKARIISDYIAGMTDRFAIKEYEKHTGLSFNKQLLKNR